MKFLYKIEESRLFGTISKPIIDAKIYSEKFSAWFSFKKILADTGADISLLPKFMGNQLIKDITKGIPKKIKGVVPNTFIQGYIHNLFWKIGYNIFKAPVFIADSDNVGAILGRTQALDNFNACFLKGKHLVLKEGS